MVVLSLFDGISAGQVALERAGIKVDKYYASEIDKYAIQITQKNYPNTIQLGDITNWKEWGIEQPDLIMGGSPCQGFSIAGKGLNFEDPRSKLFFVFSDILKHYKPKYFLLENVIMKSEHNDIISRILGGIYPEATMKYELFDRASRLEPFQLNSSLVSAQNRQRLYWTNIRVKGKPEDKKIYLKDIIENGEGIIKDHGVIKDRQDKAMCLDANYFKGVDNHGQRTMIKLEAPNQTGKDSTNRDFLSKKYIPNNTGKANCLLTGQGDMLSSVFVDKVVTEKVIQKVSVRKHEVDIDNLKILLSESKSKLGLTIKDISEKLGVLKTTVEHWFRNDTYFAIPEKEVWLNLKSLLQIEIDDFDESIMEFEEKDSVYDMTNRVYDINGKSPTLLSNKSDYNIKTSDRCLQVGNADLNIHESAKRVYSIFGKSPTVNACGGGNLEPKITEDDITWRKLTPLECERLQTFPDFYTEGVSNTQRYKSLGNSWTVDMVSWIFNFIKKEI